MVFNFPVSDIDLLTHQKRVKSLGNSMMVALALAQAQAQGMQLRDGFSSLESFESECAMRQF